MSRGSGQEELRHGFELGEVRLHACQFPAPGPLVILLVPLDVNSRQL